MNMQGIRSRSILWGAFLVIAIAIVGCKTSNVVKGAAVGTVVGGTAGALLTKKNKAVGIIAGAAVGGLIGAAIGDLQTSYAMTGLSGGWHRQLNRRYDIGIGGDLRWLYPFGDGADLPIDLRLFNGGSRSVRSFPERELGPAVGGYSTGGEASWNVNAELMRKFGDSLRAVAFIDAGSLARDYDGIASADVELAAGLGLRFDLPIGPVRLEYGYNLTRDSGEPAGTLHFAIGMAY